MRKRNSPLINKLVGNHNLDLRNPVTYSPSDIKRYYTIDFDVKLSDGRNLQRPHVWTLEQRREFIKSVLKELVLPPIHVALQTQKDIMRIIDGKQRLSTVIDFIDNKFDIIVDNQSYYFDDMDDTAKYVLQHSTRFDTIIHYEYDDDMLSDQDLISWFEMVNYSGTPQDIEHLKYLKNE